MKIIGVTGSEGLIGGSLVPCLEAQGYRVHRLDVRVPQGRAGHGSILDPGALERFTAGCCGIVHLAAVSRVVWGEAEPEQCLHTNVTGTQNVLAAAAAAQPRPWVLFASSREVYGQPANLPVSEDAPLLPMNVYGRSKLAGEELMGLARSQGMRTAILRFSNVYGDPNDHPDRVVPAFARAAACGAPLRVDGADHTFDFTHVDDISSGILLAIKALEGGEERLPPLHLVGGRATTLGELAQLAGQLGGLGSRITHAPPRRYDVSRFCGDPRRAEAVLGFRTRIDLREGVQRLVRAFAARAAVLLGTALSG